MIIVCDYLIYFYHMIPNLSIFYKTESLIFNEELVYYTERKIIITHIFINEFVIE